MRSLVFIFTVIALFIGCTKIPEKTDIEEILNKIEEERAAKCGDWIVDKNEQCDFRNNSSCEMFFNDMMGPVSCNNCMLDFSSCVEKETCTEKLCDNRSECALSSKGYNIICKCNERYKGVDCEECANGFHSDLDGQCIPNEICTEIGCGDEKRKKCAIKNSQAVCECVFPWIGNNCNECNGYYYLEDGDCKNGSCAYAECKYYEECIPIHSSKPICVCAGENQLHEDCSKCKTGYDWINFPDFCVNEKYQECSSNTDAPQYSNEISANCKITYSEENGWSDCYCNWRLGLTGNIAAINPSGNIMLFGGYQGKFFTVENYKTFETGIAPVNTFIDLKILPDGNYYIFGNDKKGLGRVLFLTTPDSREIIKIKDNSNGNNSILTFTKDGRIFQGDVEHTFPYSKKINSESISDSNSITITDKTGNTYTIYSDGKLFSSLPSGAVRWSVDYEDVSTSLYAALSNDKKIYLPVKEASEKAAIYILSTENGDLLKKIPLESMYFVSSISIGKKYLVVSSKNGDIQQFTKDGTLVRSARTRDCISFPPIILDNGNIYVFRNGYLYFFNNDLTLNWLQTTNSKKMFFYNHTVLTMENEINIFNAPGTPEGDWPQYLHDSMQSGSMEEIEFVDPPLAPVSVIPKDSAVFDTNSVTFSWQIDSGDPEIKYTLLLRDSTGYDKVYAGPEIGLSTATVNDLSSGSYEWRVVSKDKNGSLNVSDARTFTVE